MKPTASSSNLISSGTARKYQLTVNTYDRTATLLIALLVLVGVTVSGLVVVFLTNRTFPTIEPVPVVPVEASSASANQGLATEPDQPGMEEAPDLTEPQLQNTLEAITSTTAVQKAILSDLSNVGEEEVGKGKGDGDARLAGTGNDGVVERVPRWERWKIRFAPKSESEFARWLDHHKIEIGVLGRDNLVHYAFNLSNSIPDTRAEPPTKETRGYTSAADGPMPALTMRLARKANIARQGEIALLFYPFEVESVLWNIEKQHDKDRDVDSIRETVFTVVRGREGFVFEIVSQKYF